jgi:hypothetical protein
MKRNKILLLFIGIVGFITINLSVVSTTPSIQLSFKDIILKAQANQETIPLMKKICSGGSQHTGSASDFCLWCTICDTGGMLGYKCIGYTSYCD